MRLNLLYVTLFSFLSTGLIYGQEADKKSIAIISIDSKGLELDNLAMGSLVRLELEKLEEFEVLDKYDAMFALKQENIDPNECFGKKQLVAVGKLLNADKMLTGSAEKFGDKIIFILRLIDVEQSKIEKTSVMEYVYQEEDIQVMTRLSLYDLLGKENNQEHLEILADFNRPVTNEKTTLRLNGPRFGLQMANAEIARRIEAPENVGGFGGSRYMSVFGYQHEIQYISKGEFQALFEFIGAVNGIESKNVTASISILNGRRFRGWEVGFGPVFRLAKMAKGYYNENGEWHLQEHMPEGENYNVIENLDSRGHIKLTTGLVVAVGKTFTSGYLNFPVNVYWSPNPSLNSSVFGVVLGFSVTKKRR